MKKITKELIDKESDRFFFSFFFFNAINKRIKWKMQRMKDKIAPLRK